MAADLGDAVDELGDLVAEALAELLGRGQRVLEDVVQQPDRDADLVEAQLGQQIGDLQRVGDVRLAGGAPLIAVLFEGEVVDAPQELLVEGPAGALEALQDVFQAEP